MFEADINCPADLAAHARAILAKVNGNDEYALDYWPNAWREIAGYAEAIGLSGIVDSLGPPIQTPSYIAKYEVSQARLRDKMRDFLGDLIQAIEGHGQQTTDDGTYDEKAVMAKYKNPHWSDQQIADHIGCHVKTLYKPNMTGFQAAKEALKRGKEKYRRDV